MSTVSITVASGPTSPGTTADWELFFARRALATLKARLGADGLLELLRPQIDASTATLSEWIGASEGRWQPSVTELQVTGLSAEEFLAHFESISHEQPRMLAAQPEHFVLRLHGDTMQVVENLGPHITDLALSFTGEQDAVAELSPDHPIRMVGHAALPNGKVVAHLLHQFRNTTDGFDVLLGIYFPATAPEEFIEAHRQHLAVEFTNWFRDAGQALGR